MSELKATTVYDAYWKANSVGEGTGVLVYPKSEADKVIADLEESHKMEVEQLLMEIVGLKDKLQNVSELLKETREWLIESQKMHKRCADNAIKKIRHQKFKRCLAMAKWCKMSARENDTRMCLPMKCKLTRHEEYLYFIDYYHKWHRRWLELAEKFKPDLTAQQGKGK